MRSFQSTSEVHGALPHLVEPHFVERRSPKASGWRVVHACDSVRAVLPALEAQTAVGMRPYVLTPQGECLARSCFRTRTLEIRKPASLLNAWSEVRNWRRNLVESELETGIPAIQADLVHAHCFSAGMAAVRNCRTVVYSVYHFVEEQPNSRGVSKDHSWLARSFAVAEQFVLARAGAVVVHSGHLRQGIIQRGCAPENVFHIPEPMSPELIDFLVHAESLFPVRTEYEEEATFFAPDVHFDCIPSSPQKLNQTADCLLQAFALLRQEVRGARLFVPATPACAGILLRRTTALGIAGSVFAIPAAHCEHLFTRADVIIALGCDEGAVPEPAAQSESGLSHLSAAMRAMIAGTALLAADTPGQRDLSPEGRGLLWFRGEDPQDLAARAAFLASNPDLCRSLGASARQHLLETRSLEAVGRQYDAVYRYVFGRSKSDSLTPATALRLQPVAACL